MVVSLFVPPLQYHVTDEGGSALVRTIPVDRVGVVKMLSSDNGKYVYTMSTNTVSQCMIIYTVYSLSVSGYEAIHCQQLRGTRI